MAIVTQYGVRITDRVVITTTRIGSVEVFVADFDGERIPGHSYSGAGAARLAKNFLEERTAHRRAAAERERERAEAQAAREQYWDDDAFLQTLADKLRIERGDLDRLIEIANRRRP